MRFSEVVRVKWCDRSLNWTCLLAYNHQNNRALFRFDISIFRFHTINKWAFRSLNKFPFFAWTYLLAYNQKKRRPLFRFEISIYSRARNQKMGILKLKLDIPVGIHSKEKRRSSFRFDISIYLRASHQTMGIGVLVSGALCVSLSCQKVDLGFSGGGGVFKKAANYHLDKQMQRKT